MVDASVICPVCAKEGQTSTVVVDCIIKTTMAPQYFYDEAGHWHIHDPNTTTIHYRCGRNHYWADRRYATCSCGWSPTPLTHYPQDTEFPLDIS